MCMTVRADRIRIRTAEKDIEVYKVLGRGNVSTNYSCRWNPNETKKVKKFGIETNMEGKKIVNAGLHSYNSQVAASRRGGGKVVKMVIPKGTKYIAGFFNNSQSIRNRVSLALKTRSLKDVTVW